MKMLKQVALERRAKKLQDQAEEIRNRAVQGSKLVKKMRRKADAVRAELQQAIQDLEAAKRTAADQARAMTEPLEAEAKRLLDEARGITPPNDAKAFIESLWRGVNWGSPFTIIWHASPFVIIRRPGYTYPSGRLIGSSYHPPEYWLVNTKLAKGKWGLNASEAGTIAKHEGKAPKGMLDEWAAAIRKAITEGKDRVELEAHEIPDDVTPLKK